MLRSGDCLSPRLYDIDDSDDSDDNGQHYDDNQNRVGMIEFGKSA